MCQLVFPGIAFYAIGFLVSRRLWKSAVLNFLHSFLLWPPSSPLGLTSLRWKREVSVNVLKQLLISSKSAFKPL